MSWFFVASLGVLQNGGAHVDDNSPPQQYAVARFPKPVLTYQANTTVIAEPGPADET